MSEIWKDVIGYEGYYQISNLGNVRSLDRTIEYKNGRLYHKKGHIMSCNKDTKGYFTISFTKNNHPKRWWIHRLVAQAFLSDFDESLVVNHIDGVKTNNQVSNLEMVTSQGNTEHARRIGLIDDYGENSARAKLTNIQAQQIRERYAKGNVTMRQLGGDYGVCSQTICNIVNYKEYNRV